MNSFTWSQWKLEEANTPNKPFNYPINKRPQTVNSPHKYKKIHEAAHEFSRTQGCIEYSNIRIFGRRWFIRHGLRIFGLLKWFLFSCRNYGSLTSKCNHTFSFDNIIRWWNDITAERIQCGPLRPTKIVLRSSDLGFIPLCDNCWNWAKSRIPRNKLGFNNNEIRRDRIFEYIRSPANISNA